MRTLCRDELLFRGAFVEAGSFLFPSFVGIQKCPVTTATVLVRMCVCVIVALLSRR